MLQGHSDPLFAPANLLMKTHRPSIEIPAQENSLQKYKERVERLPQQDSLFKNCTDAGTMTAFWPRPLFFIKPFWAQTFANHPWPQLGQWGCSLGQFVAHVLFFGPSPDPPCPRPPCPTPPVRDPVVLCGVSLLLCCVVLCCVVLCGEVWGVGAVCVLIFVGALSRTPRSPDTLPPDRPKFRAIFSLSCHNFLSFFLS